MIIATENLSKEYDGVYRVQDLDIRVKEGDIYGFLGPNGAGKSTTMKMLLGLVKPTSGTIEIMGKLFNEKNRKGILQSVGSLIEAPSYYGHLTGHENMELIRRLLDLPQKNIDEAIHIVRLENQMNKKVKNYSLGMKQRLAIALAVMHDPELLILDDLGTERNSEYALGIVFSVIDRRYRSGRPLIVTTNLPIKQLKEETNIEKKRIYDRILEMCVPLYVGGSSYRSDIAHEKMGKMKTFFATAESSQTENIIEQTGTKTI